ncbi:MAG: hypothetical protein ACKO1K_09225 [Burkholderiales bacterium]
MALASAYRSNVDLAKLEGGDINAFVDRSLLVTSDFGRGSMFIAPERIHVVRDRRACLTEQLEQTSNPAAVPANLNGQELWPDGA